MRLVFYREVTGYPERWRESINKRNSAIASYTVQGTEGAVTAMDGLCSIHSGMHGETRQHQPDRVARGVRVKPLPITIGLTGLLTDLLWPRRFAINRFYLI